MKSLGLNFEDEGATCGHSFSNKKPKHSIGPVLFTWSFDKIKVLVLYQNSLHIWDWVPQTFGKSDYSQDDYSYSLCTFKKYRFWKLLKRGVSTKCIVWPVKPLMQHKTQLYIPQHGPIKNGRIKNQHSDFEKNKELVVRILGLKNRFTVNFLLEILANTY